MTVFRAFLVNSLTAACLEYTLRPRIHPTTVPDYYQSHIYPNGAVWIEQASAVRIFSLSSSWSRLMSLY
jgi:hypothetical protein